MMIDQSSDGGGPKQDEYCFQQLREDFHMARSIASLTISFGMVAIPVDLYSASLATERLSFHLLHAKDGSRLKQQYICLKDGKVVERTAMVKGYEFAKDQYVIFTPEELKALDEVGTNTIDIGEFV